MWMIAYVNDKTPRGWCVIDVVKFEGGEPFVLAGPYNTLAEAAEAVELRAYRIAQGWKP